MDHNFERAFTRRRPGETAEHRRDATISDTSATYFASGLLGPDKYTIRPSPEEKNEFLNLARSNEDMGTDYIIELAPLRGDEHS